jgi:hypothetical protein
MNNLPAMTVESLAEHLRLLDVATTEDHDELLLDLLERAWPTRATLRAHLGRSRPQSTVPWRQSSSTGAPAPAASLPLRWPSPRLKP